MQAIVTTVHDPFHPMRGREVRLVQHQASIGELAPVTQKPFVCIRNGQAVLRKDWGEKVVDGEVIAFVTLPQGGGGGGSNPLRILLMVAVMWAAPYAGNYLAGQMLAGGMITSAATAGMVGSVLGGIIGMAGMMLVNALIPPPKTAVAASQPGMPGSSPTYNLQAQGNMARLDAPIPVHYGRLKFFPDFGAQPYAEYYGNEQYLYQLLVLGQGYYDVEAIQIEDTSIDSWDDITYEVIEPNGTLTLFPANVVTSGEVSGQEASGIMTGTYSQTGTTVTVTVTDHLLLPGSNIYLDFTTGTADDGAYEVVTAPTSSTFTVTSASSETTSGAVTLYKYIGPFVANAAATDANALGIDVVMPSGLFYYDTSGNMNTQTVTLTVEAQEIDDAGTPVGAWATLGSPSITAATTTPQRFSYRYSVTSGRYQVRLRRTNAESTGTGYSSSMVWAGLRAYLPDVRDFGFVTLLAMRLKASNNLSMQSSRKINVIATRRLNSWHPSTGWTTTPTASRSIAWALADMLQADYGGKLADARIDLAALYTLDGIWEARNDHLDGRFDSTGTLWDSLTTAAIAGRAKPYIQGGIVHFTRDQEQAFPVALFSMRNIVKGSFNIDYLMTSDETADAVDVSYFSDVSWAPQRVPAALPSSSSLNPAKLNFFGITDREHAYREGIYFAAANRYRRKLIKFSTEMEGFIPSFGDLIAIQHDMPQWGQYAECTAWDLGTLTLTVNEPMTFGSGTHYIGLRKKDGGLAGPYVVTAGATAYDLVLAEAPSFTPYTGSDYERTHITFGWGETWRQEARVISVRPRGHEQVEIEAINEDPSVHAADEGVFAPAISSSQLTTLYTAPVIAGLTAVSAPDDVLFVLLSWQAAAGADYYIIEQSADEVEWSRVAETRANNFSFRVAYGNGTVMRVCAVGLTKGPWVTINYGSVADYMWDAVDTTLMWGTSTDLMWR